MQTRPFDLGQALQQAFALHRQGQLRHAEKIYARILKASPGNFDALHLLALLKADAKQIGEAYQLMSAALKINPSVPDAWANFANVLHALKRYDEALGAIDKALALRPGDLGFMQQRGNAFLTLGRPVDALSCFDAVLRTNSGPDSLNGRGLALVAIGRTSDALAAFDAALASAPLRPDILYNRANALLALDRLAEAVAAFDRVLARVPNHAKAWINRGRALQNLNLPAEAVPCFEKALGLDRDDADARFNLALALLSIGNYERGFGEYEWRWKRTGMQPRKSSKPVWLGEFPASGRTILLQAEQGLGDTIQFARYVPLLARMGAKVVLEVQPELKVLLSSMTGVNSCHARGDPLPGVDLTCPMGSLPLALKTTAATIPADLPYLAADHGRLAKWRKCLSSLPGKRVAIAWAGHARHVNDRSRSLELDLLTPLFALPGVSFISVQRDLREGNAEKLARYSSVTHVGDELKDMADTAAVLALSDVTLAVDTSVVHLAGALGRATWIMLPLAADWRWGVSGETSAWYPQARLFRPTALGDWAAVITRVRDALVQFAT